VALVRVQGDFRDRENVGEIKQVSLDIEDLAARA
jgi:hypothetical protein